MKIIKNMEDAANIIDNIDEYPIYKKSEGRKVFIEKKNGGIMKEEEREVLKGEIYDDIMFELRDLAIKDDAPINLIRRKVGYILKLIEYYKENEK